MNDEVAKADRRCVVFEFRINLGIVATEQDHRFADQDKAALCDVLEILTLEILFASGPPVRCKR
jgi:hypothetical protein